MKGKINIKSIIVVVLLLVVCVLSVIGVKSAKTYLSGAAVGMEPKNVNGISLPEGNTATISWISEKASMGVVEYGTTPASLLLRAIEQEQVVSHKLTLSELKPGVTYYYRIRVGDEIYDNSGIPYTFKTAKNENSVAIPSPAAQAQITPVIDNSTGACNRETDYNKDGVINSIDYIYCSNLNKTNTATSSTTITPTVAPVTNKCDGVDFDNNGIVNTLDIIKCRQSTN